MAEVDVMVFIDGNNLFHSAPMINMPTGQRDFSRRIDFDNLPWILMEEVGRFQPKRSLDLKRVNYVASVPINYDPEDRSFVEKQLEFYERLRSIPHYQVRLMEINFRGHPVRARKDDAKPFEPKESKVDMEIAALMLEHCYNDDYDVAILIAGDSDYAPALKRIIGKGKHVALFGIHASCSQEFAVFNPELLTWPVIWIDDLPYVWDPDIKWKRDG